MELLLPELAKHTFQSWPGLWCTLGSSSPVPISLWNRKVYCWKRNSVTYSWVRSRPYTHVATVLLGNPATGCNWVLRMFLKCISQMLARGSPQSPRRILLFPGKVRKWISMMINWFYSKDFPLFWKDCSVLWCFFSCERSMYAGTGVCPVWVFCCLHPPGCQECPRPSFDFLALSWALLLIHWPCRLCPLHRDSVHTISKNTLQVVFDALPLSLSLSAWFAPRLGPCFFSWLAMNSG